MEGKNGRGRPRTQWSQNIQGWLEMKSVKCKRKAEYRKNYTMTVNLRDGEDT